MSHARWRAARDNVAGHQGDALRLIERLHPNATQDALWRLPLSFEQPPDFSFACPRTFTLLATTTAGPATSGTVTSSREVSVFAAVFFSLFLPDFLAAAFFFFDQAG